MFPVFVACRLNEFRVAFKRKYGFDERDAHYLLEKFTNFKQREGDSVVAYHTNFTQMVTEMTLLLQAHDVPSEATQRARFINGLKLDIKSLVMRTVSRHPGLSLYDVMQEALMEERQLPRKTRVRPTINAMDGRGAGRGHGRGRGKRTGELSCGFCGSTEHTWDHCPKIAKRKAAGTWEDRPKPAQ